MSVGEEVFPTVGSSSIRVGLERVASFPTNTRFQDLVDAPDSAQRLFVVDTRGRVFMVEDDAVDDALFLDLTGRRDFQGSAAREGLRSLAFHPDSFSADLEAEGRGLFYTAHTAPLASRSEGVRVFDGKQPEKAAAFDLVIAEWRFDPETLVVDHDSKREVFRVETANTPHAVGAIRFNPAAEPGDPDYGNLYVPIGDLSEVQLARRPGRPNGKFFRIDPLEQSDGEPYRVPGDNPFVGDPAFLPEIFASGARNPQTMFVDHLTGLMLFADVGDERVEEVNILLAGANYGWPGREGPLARSVGPTYDHVPSPLPANDTFHYPITGYDHSATAIPQDAIALGGVIRGGPVPALDGKAVFSNFPDGSLFVADAGSFAAAVADGRVTPDEFVQPERLTELEFEGAPTTLLALLGGAAGRADARFGMDAAGNLYVFGKHNGQLYRFVAADGDAPRLTVDLVDTRTDGVLARLADGADVVADAPAAFRGLVAAVDGAAGSVLLRLFDAEGRLVASTIDSRAPFALFGDDGAGDYVDPWTQVPAGAYTLAATVFAEAEASGAILGETTLSFQIRDLASTPRLVFSLLDTDADIAIAAIADGDTIDPGAPASRRGFAVEVLDAPGVGSLRIEMFGRDGALLAEIVDDAAPYALFGDTPPGDFAASPFAVLDDRYTLRATAYAEPGGIGEALVSDSVTFTLQEGTFVFNLIDTRTNAAVAALADGIVVDVDVPANRRALSVELLGVNSEDSMTLDLFDASGALLLSATDSEGPYAIFGKGDGGAFAPSPFAFAPGVYTLRARAFAEDGGLGDLLAASTITFAFAGTDIILEGTGGRDELVGGDAGETFFGLGGNDVILARNGADTIFGGPGADYIYAGAGDDVIDGGPGVDRITGGPGADTIFLRDPDDFDYINGFEIGIDRIIVEAPGIGREQLRVGVENAAAVLEAVVDGAVMRLAVLRGLAGAQLDDLLGPADALAAAPGLAEADGIMLLAPLDQLLAA